MYRSSRGAIVAWRQASGQPSTTQTVKPRSQWGTRASRPNRVTTPSQPLGEGDSPITETLAPRNEWSVRAVRNGRNRVWYSTGTAPEVPTPEPEPTPVAAQSGGGWKARRLEQQRRIAQTNQTVLALVMAIVASGCMDDIKRADE